MKAVHIDPVCRRVSGAQNRGNSVYTELSAEYVQCFRKMSFCDNRKWRKCILACAEPVLWIAISACIPMLSSSIEASLAEARSSKGPMVEALNAAAAGAATPHALVVRAPERDHVHRRGVLYIPLIVASPIPRRHIHRDLASSSRRRIGEAEAWLQLRGWRQTFFGQGTGPRQVRSHRDPGLTQKSHALCRTIAASVPMSSHIPLQCARAGLLLGASVGALRSRCDNAA
jgi:hypothetical protein